MEGTTLSFYWSFKLQDLFNFYDSSLKALIGEQEATSGLRTLLIDVTPLVFRGGFCTRWDVPKKKYKNTYRFTFGF